MIDLPSNIGGVNLKWSRLNSLDDIVRIASYGLYDRFVVFVENLDYAKEFTKNIENSTYGNFLWFYGNGKYDGFDYDLDAYPFDGDDWTKIGTFYIPERKAAKII